MKNEYSFVDIAKLFFAIGIVAIHCKVFKSDNVIIWTILHAVFRLAVPFFFCASGFFLYKSLKNAKNIKTITFKYIKRLMIPFVFWLIINLPVLIYTYAKNGDGIIKIVIKIIRGAIFYPWGSLWFVSSLILAIIIIIPFYKKNKLKNIVLLGIIFYLFALLCNTYYFVIEGKTIQKIVDIVLKIIVSARNGVFEGTFFVTVGMYISKLSDEEKIDYKKNNIVFIILYILLLIEIILTKNKIHIDDHSLFIMFIPFIPSLFLFLSQFSIKQSTKKIRNYSTGIYFSHRFILGIVTLIINETQTILVFFITIIIVFTILLILYKLDNKKINILIK